MLNIFYRRLKAFSAWLLLVLVLASCDQSTDQKGKVVEPVEKEERLRIALVMKTLTNPFFVMMEQGARQAEKDFDIDLLVRTGAQETAIVQQIEIIAQLVASKSVDAIVIAPGDSVDLIPVLKQASDAGIKVVNIDNRLDFEVSKKHGLKNVPFISVDNAAAAYLSAKYIVDQAGGKGKAAILEGIQSAKNAQDRRDGAMKAFNEASDVAVVASKSANWKIDEAYDRTAEIFTEHPDITLLFCANDMMALGAAKYVEENQLHAVMIAGFDALDEAREAIEQGKMSVTIDQQAATQGYQGVASAVKMLKGEPVSDENYVEVLVIHE